MAPRTSACLDFVIEVHRLQLAEVVEQVGDKGVSEVTIAPLQYTPKVVAMDSGSINNGGLTTGGDL